MQGYTSLHVAASHGRSEIVDLLLEYGASSQLVRKNGLSALHMACQYNYSSVSRCDSSVDACLFDANCRLLRSSWRPVPTLVNATTRGIRVCIFAVPTVTWCAP